MEPPAGKGERLARIIAGEIVHARMDSGDAMGTITDLASRHTAGTAAIRQAVMLLEQQGLVELRRGNGGGVTVARTGAAAAAMALGTHLLHLDLDDSAVFSVRAGVDGAAAQLAARRGSLEQALALRTLAADAAQIDPADLRAHFREILRHAAAILEMGANPLLGVFSDALRALTSTRVPDPSRAELYRATIDESLRYRAAISEAILSRDGPAARTLCEEWNLVTIPRLGAAALARHHPDGNDPAPSAGPGRALLEHELTILQYMFDRKGRIAEALVRLLSREIREGQLCAGTRLGAEGDLMARFGVSRPALRQALGFLARHGTIETRAGKAGGIFVGAGDVAATLQAFGEQIAPLGIGAADLAKARRCILPPLARELAALPPDERMRIGPSCEDVVHVAESAGLNIWALFARALGFAGPGESGALGEAIRQGDAALAARQAQEWAGHRPPGL